MPLYQFELVSPHSKLSLDSALLEDDNQAEDVGLSLASDLRTARPELIGQGYEVSVKDDRGNEISHIQVDPA